MDDPPPIARGELLFGGPAQAALVALSEPISFWGGVDPIRGEIVDQHHPQFGTSLKRVAMLSGGSRGSSSSTSVILECVRRGTAPAMFLLTEPDLVLTVGIAAGWELYGRGPTVVLLAEPPEVNGVRYVGVDASGVVRALDRLA